MLLNGFFRGKVIINKDLQLCGRIGVYIPKIIPKEVSNIDSSDDIDQLQGNLKTNYIWVRSANHINLSKKDEEVWHTNSGNFEVPREGSYVLVFFLNNNIEEGYFLPGYSLGYDSESIIGKNLLGKNKIDFLDYERKPNIKVEEFHNGTITGVNFNDDANEWFFNFDNGTSFKLSSPNEQNEKKSNEKKPSIFDILIKRKDSLFKAIHRIITTKKTLSKIINKTILQKKSDGSIDGYNDNFSSENNFESSIINTTTQDNTSIETSSLLNNKNIQSSIIDNNNINTSNVLKNIKLSLIKNKDYYNILNDMNISETNVDYNIELFSNIDSYNKENILYKNKKNINNDELIFNDSREVQVNSNNKKSKIFSLEKCLPTKNIYISNNNINEDGSYGNITNNIQIEKESILDKKSYEIYQNANNKFITINKSSKIDSDDTNTEINVNNVTTDATFRINGNNDYKDISIESSFVEENPLNTASSYAIEGVPDLFRRGQQLSIHSEKDKSITSVKSIRESGIPGLDIPKMGMSEENNTIFQIKEEGTNTEIKYDVKGINPIYDTLIKIISDNIETYVHETISGNIKTKTKTGTIFSEAMNIEIKSKMKTIIESTIETQIKSALINLIADGQIKINAPNVEISGGTLNVKGHVTPDGNGPFNCIPICPFTGAPHCGSIVVGT